MAAPLVAALYLWLRQGDFFGLAVGGPWPSFSLLELAIYVVCARRENLPLVGFGDDRAAISAYGLDVITDLCVQLLEGGAPGLHFYTLNRANATLKIWQRLKTRGLL